MPIDLTLLLPLPKQVRTVGKMGACAAGGNVLGNAQ